jgi:tryptophan-rich sensory protein
MPSYRPFSFLFFLSWTFVPSLHSASSVAFWRGDMDTLPHSLIFQFVYGPFLHGKLPLVCMFECILGIMVNTHSKVVQYASIHYLCLHEARLKLLNCFLHLFYPSACLIDP